MWGSDVAIIDDSPFFARSTADGSLLIHGIATETGSLDGDDEWDFDLDLDFDIYELLGISVVKDPHSPFVVSFDDTMKITMLIASRSGSYELVNLNHDRIALTMILSDADDNDDEEVHWNLDDEYNFIDRTSIDIEAGHTYMLVTSLLDETQLGSSATLQLRAKQKGVTAPFEPAIKTTPITDVGSATSIAAGSFTSFVVTNRERLMGAGTNDQGQLGQGSVAAFPVFTIIMHYTKAATGGTAHSLFLGSDGRLFATGRNEEGQVGASANPKKQTSPILVADGVIDMAAGFGHTLFVKKDGSLWAYGSNTNGQLGTGDTVAASVPVKVMDKVVRVWSSFGNTSFALRDDGSLYGWGNNSYGNLGIGTKANVNRPTLITGDVVAVAAGQNFTWVLKRDGTLYSSGENSLGQLGKPGQMSSSTLLKVASSVKAIAAGNYTGYYIDEADQLWVAGSNQQGQWGNGTTRTTSIEQGFVKVLDNIKEVAAGSQHAIVLKNDGTVWTTGSNGSMQLGDRSDGFRTSWKQVATIVD